MEENILSASVPLALGGKAFRLSYRAHAFITYAEVCKRDLLQDIRGFGEEFKALGSGGGEGVNSAMLFLRVRDMLWAALLEAHPDIERAAAGHLFGFGELVAIMNGLTDALKLTAPAPSPSAGRPILPPETSAGSRRIDGPLSGQSSETVVELQPASSAA